jgi:hypothetical protein
MSYLSRHVFALLIVVAAGCGAPAHQRAAEDPVDIAAATELVRQYVDRDAQGERLRFSPWFAGAVVWPDDPGYDQFTLISGWEIGPAWGSGDTVRVTVKYDVVGQAFAGTEGDRRFMPNAGSRSIEFKVVLSARQLKIAGPQIEQHVLVAAAIRDAGFGALDKAALGKLLSP